MEKKQLNKLAKRLIAFVGGLFLVLILMLVIFPSDSNDSNEYEQHDTLACLVSQDIIKQNVDYKVDLPKRCDSVNYQGDRTYYH